MAYSWPGNVRELENVVERALILGKDHPLTFDDIVWANDGESKVDTTFSKDEFLSLDIVNARHIKKALKMTKGKIHGKTGAAELLGLNPSTLRHRIRKLGILQGRRKYIEG
jgi:DNA-binding NtrC family response regulator